LFTLCLSVTLSFITAYAGKDDKSWPEVDAKAVAEWRELGFGMFIHWGPVSLTGHEIGWSRGKQNAMPLLHSYCSLLPVQAGMGQRVRVVPHIVRPILA